MKPSESLATAAAKKHAISCKQTTLKGKKIAIKRVAEMPASGWLLITQNFLKRVYMIMDDFYPFEHGIYARLFFFPIFIKKNTRANLFI